MSRLGWSSRSKSSASASVTAQLDVLTDVDLTVAGRREGRDHRPQRLRQDHPAALRRHLERPTSGHVEIAGDRIGQKLVRGQVARCVRTVRSPASATGIGMVFQRFNLFPHLTVLDNVMLGPIRVLKQKPGRRPSRSHATLLGKVGLAHKAGEFPERLSGGQQQRVAIARSLAMQPKLMLFDEATSALDPELVGEVLTVMRGLAQDGMTMLIVTHEMQFAEDVADRVDGDGPWPHRRSKGPPRELFRAPSHPRTQAFLRAVHGPPEHGSSRR